MDGCTLYQLSMASTSHAAIFLWGHRSLERGHKLTAAMVPSQLKKVSRELYMGWGVLVVRGVLVKLVQIECYANLVSCPAQGAMTRLHSTKRQGSHTIGRPLSQGDTMNAHPGAGCQFLVEACRMAVTPWLRHLVGNGSVLVAPIIVVAACLVCDAFASLELTARCTNTGVTW